MAKRVITIGRQFGSGGHEVGEKLAAALKIPFYDRELIDMAYERTGINPVTLSEADETTGKVFEGFLGGSSDGISDALFLAQSEVIRHLAYQGPCVIIGRCSDYVLENYDYCFYIFISAKMEDRVQRIMKKYNLSEDKAHNMIMRMDRRRRAYYNFYTDRKWGQIENHQLSIDSSFLGVDGTVEFIKKIYDTEEKQLLAKEKAKKEAMMSLFSDKVMPVEDIEEEEPISTDATLSEGLPDRMV